MIGRRLARRFFSLVDAYGATSSISYLARFQQNLAATQQFANFKKFHFSNPFRSVTTLVTSTMSIQAQLMAKNLHAPKPKSLQSDVKENAFNQGVEIVNIQTFRKEMLDLAKDHALTTTARLGNVISDTYPAEVRYKILDQVKQLLMADFIHNLSSFTPDTKIIEALGYDEKQCNALKENIGDKAYEILLTTNVAFGKEYLKMLALENHVKKTNNFAVQQANVHAEKYHYISQQAKLVGLNLSEFIDSYDTKSLKDFAQVYLKASIKFNEAYQNLSDSDLAKLSKNIDQSIATYVESSKNTNLYKDKGLAVLGKLDGANLLENALAVENLLCDIIIKVADTRIQEGLSESGQATVAGFVHMLENVKSIDEAVRRIDAFHHLLVNVAPITEQGIKNTYIMLVPQGITGKTSTALSLPDYFSMQDIIAAGAFAGIKQVELTKPIKATKANTLVLPLYGNKKYNNALLRNELTMFALSQQALYSILNRTDVDPHFPHLDVSSEHTYFDKFTQNHKFKKLSLFGKIAEQKIVEHQQREEARIVPTRANK